MARHFKSIQLDRASVTESFEDCRTDYNAAKNSRYRRRREGVQAMGSHADWHYRVESDYLRLMETARDFDRNDAIAGRAVNAFVDNTLPSPSVLDADTGDKGLDRELESRWCAFAGDADQCDVSGESTFFDMERLMLRHAIVDGDCQTIGTNGGALQMFEAHRLRTPKNTKRNVVHGILLDEMRRRLEYWFCKEDVSPLSSVNLVSDMQRIPVRSPDGTRQVFHVRFGKRISQTRGISAFAPVFDCEGMFEDINFANLVKQQAASCWAILRERDQHFAGDVLAEPGADSNGYSLTAEGIAPGMHVRGAKGETLKGFAPGIPDPQFFQHAKLILTLIGVNIGVPLIILLMDPSESNFSGYRGAMEQARLGFRCFWHRFIRQWHAPIYRFKAAQWKAEDKAMLAAFVRLGIAYYNHRWTPPKLPPIEPLKDATTTALRRKTHQSSPRRLHAEDGQEFPVVAREIVNDNGYLIFLAKKMAARLNKQFSQDGQPVHWRECLDLAMADGVTLQLAAQQVGNDDTAEKTAPKGTKS